jgi:hypothetical protein
LDRPEADQARQLTPRLLLLLRSFFLSSTAKNRTEGSIHFKADPANPSAQIKATEGSALGVHCPAASEAWDAFVTQ